MSAAGSLCQMFHNRWLARATPCCEALRRGSAAAVGRGRRVAHTLRITLPSWCLGAPSLVVGMQKPWTCEHRLCARISVASRTEPRPCSCPGTTRRAQRLVPYADGQRVQKQCSRATPCKLPWPTCASGPGQVLTP